MNASRSLIVAVTAALAAAASFACSAQAQTDLAAARREGEVVLYTTVADKEMQKLSAAFAKVAGDIKVKWLRMVSTNIFTRFAGETQSGVRNADLILSGSAQLFLEKPDLFVPLSTAVLPNKGNVARLQPKADSYVIVLVNPHVLAYNTQLVDETTAAKRLKSWKDVADPYWRGKIGLLDPLATPNNMSWYMLMRKSYGDQFLRDIAANSSAFAASGAPASQQTAVGAFAATFPTTFSASSEIREHGAPLRVVKPDGPSHALETSLAISKAAPHPNAARVFADWLLGNEAQAIICQFGGAIPAAEVSVAGCPTLAPDHFGSVDSIPADEQKRILELLGRNKS